MRIAYSSLAAFKAKSKHLSSLLDIPSRTAALELLAKLSGYKNYHEVAHSADLAAGAPPTETALATRLVELQPKLSPVQARTVIEALSLSYSGSVVVARGVAPERTLWLDGLELFPGLWCPAPAALREEDSKLELSFFPFIIRLAGPGVPDMQSDGDGILRILCIMCTNVEGVLDTISYVPIVVPSKHIQGYAGNVWFEETPQVQPWFQAFADNAVYFGMLLELAGAAGARAVDIYLEPPNGEYLVRTVPPVGNLDFDGRDLQQFEDERSSFLKGTLPVYSTVIPFNNEDLAPLEPIEKVLKNGTGMSVDKLSTYVLKHLRKEMKAYEKAHPRRASMSAKL
jgi:hypothetical protein